MFNDKILSRVIKGYNDNDPDVQNLVGVANNLMIIKELEAENFERDLAIQEYSYEIIEANQTISEAQKFITEQINNIKALKQDETDTIDKTSIEDTDKG